MARRGSKAAKLVRREDPFRVLPDDVLSTIISLLPLKEAVRTSILSKRWRSIWTCHSELGFDAASVLGISNCPAFMSEDQSKSNSQMLSSKFVERVDQFMCCRFQGPKVNSFSIHFPLGKEFTSHIDQWISFAVMKEVENIDLDLSEDFQFDPKMDYTSSNEFQIYEFPCWLFAASRRRCTLKHLRLASCYLSALPKPNTLTSLITVDLHSVSISDQQLQDLLSTCCHLERLSLCACNGLVNLKFSAPNLKLKFLSIKHCFGLQTIEIHAADLVTFEYGGHLPSFLFKNAPKLAKASLDFFIRTSRMEGVMYALTRFPSGLPQLETLNLMSVLTLKNLQLPENGPIFTNIKQFELTVFPFDDGDNLSWIGYILKAFPLMQKLELNLCTPSCAKEQKEIERFLPECPHKHISKLQINGFYGNQQEVDLLQYLIHNLVALELLVVAPIKNRGRFITWVSKPERPWFRSRLHRVYEWLLAVLPRTVCLEIW